MSFLSKVKLRINRLPWKTTRENALFHWMILILGFSIFIWCIFIIGKQELPEISAPQIQIAHTTMAVTQFSETVKMLVTFSLGLFAAVAFLLKGIWAHKEHFSLVSSIFLCVFLLLSAGSLYYGTQARFAVVDQIEHGVFNYAYLQEIVFWQAFFLLLAALTALVLLWQYLAPDKRSSNTS